MRKSRNGAGRTDRKMRDREMGFLSIFLSPVFLSAGVWASFLAGGDEFREGDEPRNTRNTRKAKGRKLEQG
jgi:hypothetical protein